MNRFILVVINLMFGVGVLNGQTNINTFDFKNYKPLYCEGDLPESLNSQSSSKALSAIARIERKKKGSRKDRKLEREHAIESNFLEDQMLMSGQVLFGDPLTNYVSKVGNTILNADDGLKGTMQFFVLKSTIPNAYATSNGLVFVSIGLLSRLENESQLAMILAHEIQHYIKKHSLKKYKTVKKAIASIRKAHTGDLDNKINDIYRFSKKQELEADLLGLELLVDTKYDLAEGLNVFEILKFTEYPFLETKLDFTDFQNKDYNFPQEAINQVYTNVTKGEEGDKAELEPKKDDDKSTHPSLNFRIEKLQKKIDSLNLKGRELFLNGEAQFKFMLKLSRYELLTLYLRRADFGRAFYLSKVMELAYEPTLYLAKVKAMSIYGMFEHKLRDHGLENYGCSNELNRGEWRKITNLFLVLNKKEFGSFGANILWEIYVNHRRDPFIIKIIEKYFERLQLRAGIKLEDYLTVQTDNAPIQKTDKDKVETSGELRNPRLRATTDEAKSPQDYYYGVFKHRTDQYELKQFFDKVKYSSSEIKKATKTSKSTELTEEQKLAIKNRYVNTNENINGLVLFQPQISRYTYGLNFGTKREWLKEEITRNELRSDWEFIANKLNFPIQILNNSINSDLSTDDMNRFSILNDWMIERLNNDTGEMILFYGDYVKPVMSSLGTNYLCWDGYEYTLSYRNIKLLMWLYSTGILVEPVASRSFYLGSVVLPILYYIQFKKDGLFKEYTMVFNTETGVPVYYGYKEIDAYWRKDFRKAQVNRTVYEIRHTLLK